MMGDIGESLRRPACAKCLHSKEETCKLMGRITVTSSGITTLR